MLQRTFVGARVRVGPSTAFGYARICVTQPQTSSTAIPLGAGARKAPGPAWPGHLAARPFWACRSASIAPTPH
eukprot:15141896-Alexandrium_andersonii.AAC.1